jgi:hypothetical protein
VAQAAALVALPVAAADWLGLASWMGLLYRRLAEASAS